MSNSKQYVKAIGAYKGALRHADTDSLRSVIWGMIGDAWHQKAEAGEPNLEERLPLQTGLLGKKALPAKP